MYLHRHRSGSLLLCSLLVLMHIPMSHLMKYIMYPCRSTAPMQWLRHSEKCNELYLCFYGQPILMRTCPSGKVWSIESLTCITSNSFLNDCNKVSDLPCSAQKGLIPNPANCNWYYNCSSIEPDLIHRCPFPQLFNAAQSKCDDIPNVNCGSRFEPFDRCDYSGYKCIRSHCRPCIYDKTCLGQRDGNYTRLRTFPSSSYVTCTHERLIDYHSCSSPTPLFSPSENMCVSFYKLPKEEGGIKPNCRFRANGYYPDEIGRCPYYFQCNNTKFEGFFQCNNGTFNPGLKICQTPDQVPPPCGSGSPPSCVGRQDGFYADLGGRCSHYFECNQSVFKSHSCADDQMAFNPYNGTCMKGIESQIQPCGIQDNLCQNRLSGFYLYNSSSHYYECYQGLFIHFGTCPKDQAFNISSKQCEISVQALCVNKADGRYKSPLAECFAFYECSQQKSTRGLTQCTDQLNGTRFNPQTGRCDKPQNVCPPCGSKSNCPGNIFPFA